MIMGLFELVLLIIFDELQLGLSVASDEVDEGEPQNGTCFSLLLEAVVAEELSSGKKTRSKPMPQFSLLFLLLLAFAMIPIFSYWMPPLSLCGFDDFASHAFNTFLALNFPNF